MLAVVNAQPFDDANGQPSLQDWGEGSHPNPGDKSPG